MQHFAVYRGRHNTAVIQGNGQFIQRQFCQMFGFIGIPVVDRHLSAERVKLGVQRAVHHALNLLFSTGQQGVYFAVAMLALHQPGLQQHQTRVLQQAFPRQRF